MPPYNRIRHSIQSDATERRETADPVEGDALMRSSEKEAYILFKIWTSKNYDLYRSESFVNR